MRATVASVATVAVGVVASAIHAAVVLGFVVATSRHQETSFDMIGQMSARRRSKAKAQD